MSTEKTGQAGNPGGRIPESGRTTRGGTLISQIHQVCGRVWSALLRKEGMADMAGARGRVLFALWTQDRIPVRTLAEKTSLDKSTLTGVVARLERDGYVTRGPDPLDRRSVLVCRTGRDNLFTEKIPAVSEKMNAVFYRGFTGSEITLFDGMLRRVLDNCKAAERPPEEHTQFS